jgi:hypothetical protein
MWKEAVLDYFRHYTSIYLEGLRKPIKALSWVGASEPRFEPGTSQLQSKSANYSSATFGPSILQEILGTAK